MAFRYVQERVNANGSKESLANDFPVDELIIGRGGESHLVLASRQLSLVHAKLRFADGRLVIEDQSSLAGVRINGKRVARGVIASGDVVQLADVRLQVKIDSDLITLSHQIELAPKTAQEDLIAKQRTALSISTYFPSMGALCVFALLVVMIFTFVIPMLTKDYKSWNSGPISNPHKMIEGDCNACHTMPFTHVQDTECTGCHKMTEHSKDYAELVGHHPQLNLRCAECHMEHNGDHGMTVRDPRACVSCHENLKGIDSKAVALNVPSFGNHPEFRVPVKDDAGAVHRIPLNDAKASDGSGIKLNHALHLKPGLRGKNGPVNLQCNSCHELTPDFKSIKPIKFENHCRDCHTLGFDDRMPTVQVPHGDDEAIYPALFTEYTKLLLLKSVDAAEPQVQPGFERSIPGGTGVPRAKSETVNATLVAKEARGAEKQLFTKTACFLCHDSSEKARAEQTDTNSHYHVTKPEIPDVWLRGARFNHGAHEEISCESCHEKTRKSSKTSDVLLPQVKLCQECHVEGEKRGFVKSDCVLCHSFHDSLSFPFEKKKSVSEYLSSVQR